jgi:hypothetical protein
MTPLTPAERDALRLRAEQADEVFSGRTVGELILDVRKARADASAGLLGAALDAILAQCIAEPFEPWPGSLVAALVAPEQLAETRVPPAVMELQKGAHLSRQRQQGESLQDVSRVKRRKAGGWRWFAAWWHPRQFASRLHIGWLHRHDIRAGRTRPRRRR